MRDIWTGLISGRMQGALGELTYESEAAERLRADLRNEKATTRSLRGELSQTQVGIL